MNLLDTVAVASRSFSKNQDLVNALEDKYSKVIFNETGATLQDQDLINFLSTADKAIIGIEKISAEVLQKLPKLKVVSKYGVGINNLDIEAFKSKGIKLGFTPGVNKQSVAELALTLTLISLRKIHRNHAEIADGIWSQEKGSELFGKTIGLLGFGNIGQKFASFLAPFNCKIIFFDEKIFSNQELLSIATTLGLKRGQMQQEDLTEVLHHSDILSIHLPLLPETENTINSKELSLLKPSISIINTARGGIVNESALHAFLSSNPDSFAAFDVYAEEPALKNPLFKLPNFFGTSH
ncbi:phosphoglycerate dehydrogenase, partial [Gammaproteobacteria bacterium]|nr:phosphoglycerate dehydrogenase [Gammaproteobacteria bacterium]